MKKMQIASSTYAVTLVTALLAATIVFGEGLSYERVRLVDKSDSASGASNLLFRGNEPIVNGQFAFDTLVTYMRQRAAEEKVAFPDEFYFVDLNFLNIAEEKDESVEKRWLDANPTKGQFVNWPILGNVLDPRDLLEPVRKEMAKTMPDWDFDKLSTRIPEMYTLLNTPQNVSHVYYGHCEAGSDRTGEVFGSYAMQFLGMDMKAAYAWDNEVAGRLIYNMSKHQMDFYCFHLYYSEGFTNYDCVNFGG
jgi:hypothetical protein